MTTDLVFWSGPVADFQVPDATIDGAERFFIGCRGDKGPHPYCPDYGWQLRSSFDNLIKLSPLQSREELGDLFLGAFSAGGSIIKNITQDPEYRDAITAIYLSDAVWTAAWADAGQRIPPADLGFVEYAVDVANGPGDKLFIATFSPNPNREFATGHENLESLKAEIEKRTGRQFVLRSSMPGGIEPPLSQEVWQLGNVVFAKYPSEPLGHGHTKIAGKIFRQIIQPWVDKGKGPIDAPGAIEPPPILPLIPPPGTGAPPVEDGFGLREMLIFGGTALAGYVLVTVLRR